jgi:hypothetical protein
VQDLEGVAPPDAMDADVHGRHSPHAQKAHQGPFVADERADPAADLFFVGHGASAGVFGVEPRRLPD